MHYQPNLEDTNFILFDVLQAPQVLAELRVFADCDADLMRQVLGEAGKPGCALG